MSYIDFARKTYGDRARDILNQNSPGQTNEGGQVFYPEDLFAPDCSPFILFFAVDPTRVGVVLDKIALYMPKDIQVNYGLNYGEAMNMVEIGKSVARGGVGEVADYFDSSLGVAALAYGGARGILGGGAIGGVGGLGTAALTALNKNNTIGQQLGLHQRKTLNPHMAATFEGVSFRRHNFVFDMVPRNERESEYINEIIYKFKFHAHPDAGNPNAQTTFWKWPSCWQIGLFSPARKYLYNISTSVISNIAVNYTNGGTRAFFSGTGAPVSVRLALEFMETELMTRGRIKEGF